MKMISNKMMKYNKIVFNVKNIVLLGINIIAILFVINSLKISNVTIRRLGDDDIRKSKPNQICMEIQGKFLFNFFELSKINTTFENDDGGSIKLQFCENIDGYQSTCIYKNGDKVIKLAGRFEGEDNNYKRIQITDYDNEKKKAYIYLAAGEKCNSGNYKVNIVLTCDEKEEFKLDKDILSFKESDCNINLSGISKYACGEDKYFDYATYGNLPVGIIVIVLGLTIGIFGYKQLDLAIYIVFIGVGVVLWDNICDLFLIESFWPTLAIFIICLILSIIIAVVFVKKKKSLFKYFLFIISGICGYFLGELLFNLVLSKIETEHQMLIRYISIIAFIVLGIVLDICFPKYVYIVGTSIIGSYFAMRGISIIFYKQNPYIDEQKLYDLANTRNFNMITEMGSKWFILYPIILVVFSAITITAQFRLNPNWKEMNYKDLDETMEQPDAVSDFMLQEE